MRSTKWAASTGAACKLPGERGVPATAAARPELPDALLPAEWPGQKARLLCKELYRRLAPASEHHLDRCLVLADGTIPPADPAFADRFPQDDPLAAMSL